MRTLRRKKIYRGLFNRYQYSKPMLKYGVEDLRCLFLLLTLALRRLLLRKQGPLFPIIFAHPHLPSKRSSLAHIAQALGLFLSNRKFLSRPVIAVYWEYTTRRNEFDVCEDLQKSGTRVLNLHNRDIGKIAVDCAFTKVFGYSTQVDPKLHRGRMVEKGDINALHDGRVIEGPIDYPLPEKIYQIEIDNRSPDNSEVIDERVVVMGKSLPLVYQKRRSLSRRFENSNHSVTLHNTREVFSEEEEELILKFCREISLELGELDVLRDRNTGKIYIVDVNNTPQSPPGGSPKHVRKEGIRRMAEAFREEFLSQPTDPATT